MTIPVVRLRQLLAMAALALSIVLAGCGDDDSGPAADEATTTTSNTATTTSDTAPDSDGRVAVGTSWSQRTAAPVAATEVGAAHFDGRIWVIGGFGGDASPLDVVQVYDPAEDSWSMGPALPVTVHHAVVVASDATLMVMGGYRGGGFGEPTESVWVLTPDAEGWEVGPSLPSPRGAGAGAWDGAQIVFGGGVGPDGLSADVWALSGNEWTSVGELSEARDHLGATSDGEGRLWFLGGRFGSLDSNRATVDLVEDGGVAAVGSLPTARGGVAGFHVPGVGACLAGGEAPNTTFDAVECIDASGGTTTLAPMNQARHGLGAVVVDGAAYILLGGPRPGLSVSHAVEALPLR